MRGGDLWGEKTREGWGCGGEETGARSRVTSEKEWGRCGQGAQRGRGSPPAPPALASGSAVHLRSLGHEVQARKGTPPLSVTRSAPRSGFSPSLASLPERKGRGHKHVNAPTSGRSQVSASRSHWLLCRAEGAESSPAGLARGALGRRWAEFPD